MRDAEIDDGRAAHLDATEGSPRFCRIGRSWFAYVIAYSSVHSCVYISVCVHLFIRLPDRLHGSISVCSVRLRYPNSNFRANRLPRLSGSCPPPKLRVGSPSDGGRPSVLCTLPSTVNGAKPRRLINARHWREWREIRFQTDRCNHDPAQGTLIGSGIWKIRGMHQVMVASDGKCGTKEIKRIFCSDETAISRTSWRCNPIEWKTRRIAQVTEWEAGTEPG